MSDKSVNATEANEVLVLYVNDQLFNHGNLSVIDRYVSREYIQHNPSVANGPEALRQLVIMLRAKNPDALNTVGHVVAEGDLVLAMSHAGVTDTFPGLAIIDVCRIEDGKLAEHWDAIQPVPAATASGHDMFSTLSGPTRWATRSDAETARNKSLVLDYLQSLTAEHDLEAVDRYVSPLLYQHDPAIEDGAAATKKAYAKLFTEHPAYAAAVAKVVAQGDFVAVHTHVRNAPADLGASMYEIFRVQEDQIVEHWSVTQNVPAASANGNSMF